MIPTLAHERIVWGGTWAPGDQVVATCAAALNLRSETLARRPLGLESLAADELDAVVAHALELGEDREPFK